MPRASDLGARRAARLHAGRQRRRLLARRRPRLVRPQARPRREQRHRDRARDRRRRAAPRRRRPRARAVLGAARRRRQLRRRHRARVRPLPDQRGLRRASCSSRTSAAREVLHAWREWTDRARGGHVGRPACCSSRRSRTSPSFLRGQSFVVVEAAFLGSEADGRALLKPLRELGPAMDTFAMRAAGRASPSCTWTRRARSRT